MNVGAVHDPHLAKDGAPDRVASSGRLKKTTVAGFKTFSAEVHSHHSIRLFVVVPPVAPKGLLTTYVPDVKPVTARIAKIVWADKLQ
jgi:hypothetical protein